MVPRCGDGCYARYQGVVMVIQLYNEDVSEWKLHQLNNGYKQVMLVTQEGPAE